MSMVALTSPADVMERLAEIENDLAVRQATLENAAAAWFRCKRDREHDRAVAFIAAEGSVAQRNAVADREVAADGSAVEAEYEAVRAVVRVLETRGSILQSILRAQQVGVR